MIKTVAGYLTVIGIIWFWQSMSINLLFGWVFLGAICMFFSAQLFLHHDKRDNYRLNFNTATLLQFGVVMCITGGSILVIGKILI